MKDNDKYYFIDTHAHLDMLKKITPQFAVKESLREGVKYIINVGSSMSGSKKSVEYSDSFASVFASVGIHPHYAKDFDDDKTGRLEEMITGHDKVIAIGESGLDYYKNLSPKKDQKKAFVSQIELAIRKDLPLIVHDRDAHDEVLDILKDYAKDDNFRAVIHCFSGDAGIAEKFLDLGFFISFTGVITFPNAKGLVDTVRVVPLDRMFIETDSPFLAPQPKRGRENYPGYVKFVALKISEIKNIDIGEVAAVTSKNAEQFFNLFNI